MNVVDAISLLKKYNLSEDAEAERKRLKITKAPYDMQGLHNVYCDLLSKQSVKISNQIRALRNIKCLEWENVEDDSRPVHDDCFFAYMSLAKNYCTTKCVYYRDKIKPLEQELEELEQAEKVLKEAQRQLDAANAANYTVEWLVSDKDAVRQLQNFFTSHNVNIKIRYYPE